MTIPLDPAEGRRLYGRSPAAYAAGRPDYPERVYRILGACGLGRGARVLEVGPGTGLTTGHLLAAGASVTAVEANRAMGTYLRQSFDYDTLEVVAQPLEEARLPAAYFDLAVAATSFHWVAQPAGWTRLVRSLRPGGWAVVWWMLFQDPDNPDAFDRQLHDVLGGDPALPDRPTETPFQLKEEARKAELVGAGLVDVSSEIIRARYLLSGEQLRSLYATTAIVLRRPDDEQRRLLDAIGQLVGRHPEGRVERQFVTALYRGRRPFTRQHPDSRCQ